MMKVYVNRVFVLSCIWITTNLFALERINLIKAHDFENNVSVWATETGVSAGFISKAGVGLQDTSFVQSGKYSAWFDTRFAPNGVFDNVRDSVIIYQVLTVPKKLMDLDSLTVFYYDSCNVDSLNHGTFSVDLLSRIETEKYLDMRYQLYYAYPFETPADLSWLKVVKAKVELNEWKDFSRNLYEDFHGTKGVSAEQEIQKVVLRCYGIQFENTWWCQKVYWDDIRLTGYADYDVGVKGFVSKDSIGKGYTPIARIKNFGRKAADSFLVIATIEGGSGTVYADTLTWSLAADTEDTLSFKEFKPSDAASYTLTVSTLMTPDESDEDDVMSKTLYGSGVEETPSPSALQLEVEALSSIRYSLPSGEQGTISLYDPTGRRVESLRVQGEGDVSFKSELATGVYFVKLEAGRTSVTKKAVVLR